jgi:hypothetical protein
VTIIDLIRGDDDAKRGCDFARRPPAGTDVKMATGPGRFHGQGNDALHQVQKPFAQSIVDSEDPVLHNPAF